MLSCGIVSWRGVSCLRQRGAVMVCTVPCRPELRVIMDLLLSCILFLFVD